MSNNDSAPTTLLEAVSYFADEEVALAFVANLRWPAGEQTCPNCGSVAAHYFLKSRRVWKCKDCRKTFSIKVGTIFEDSPIGLSKWLPAMWMLANCKNGISSYELARALGVTQKTGWFMLHRLRLAMQTGSFDKMDGIVEADETYVGGRAKFMHKSKRARIIQHKTGMSGKAIVMGLLERHGPDGHSRVRVKVVKTSKKSDVQGTVRENVAPGAALFTDAHGSYTKLSAEYAHDFVDHAREYVRGNVHTNGMENFWSLLKRSIKGTYVSVEPFHLFRYLDEQTFRFNMRKDTDLGRFVTTLATVISKRLTYAELTGAGMEVR
jgi:transposase-like protein